MNREHAIVVGGKPQERTLLADALRPAKLLTPLPLHEHHDNLWRPPRTDAQDLGGWPKPPPDGSRIDLLLAATLLLCGGESDPELSEVVGVDPCRTTGPVHLGNHVALANAAAAVAVIAVWPTRTARRVRRLP